MDSLKDRVEEVMAAMGWTTDTQVAKVAGVSRSAVAQWREKGSKDIKSIDLEPALKLEAASGFSAKWISLGEGPKMAAPRRQPPNLYVVASSAEDAEVADGYVRLPVLAEAAGGPGRDPQSTPEVVRNVDVLESWVRQTLRTNPMTLKILTVRGQSMSGVVDDGDVLFVEPCTSYDADGLYVLSVDGLVRVKRLRLRVLDQRLSIESNDGSAPELATVADVGERIHIHGRVIAAWSLKRL